MRQGLDTAALLHASGCEIADCAVALGTQVLGKLVGSANFVLVKHVGSSSPTAASTTEISMSTVSK
jgi:hypothetical protein